MQLINVNSLLYEIFNLSNILATSFSPFDSLQTGQPLLPIVDLLLQTAFHSCPLEQIHQHFFPDPATISFGVKMPFFVGCHSFVNSGCVVVKQLSLQVL